MCVRNFLISVQNHLLKYVHVDPTHPTLDKPTFTRAKQCMQSTSWMFLHKHMPAHWWAIQVNCYNNWQENREIDVVEWMLGRTLSSPCICRVCVWGCSNFQTDCRTPWQRERRHCSPYREDKCKYSLKFIYFGVDGVILPWIWIFIHNWVSWDHCATSNAINAPDSSVVFTAGTYTQGALCTADTTRATSHCCLQHA